MFGFGTQLLDVAIGLMFIYIVASLIASAIVEILETFLRTRAKYLWQGVGELLGETTARPRGREAERSWSVFTWRRQEPVAQPAAARTTSTAGSTRARTDGRPVRDGMDEPNDERRKFYRRGARERDSADRQTPPDPGASLDALYSHPLIAGLFYGRYNTATGRLMRRQLPTYIPRESFSTALIDLVSRQPRDEWEAASSVEAIRRGVKALPESHLKTALQSMMRVTGDDVVLLQRRIETWYDAAMDSVSGWYKRQAQLMLLFVGFVLAAGANIDSWRIAKILANDEPKREALLKAATEFASSQNRAGVTLTQQQMTDYVNAAGASALFNHAGIDLLSPLGWLATAFAISLGAPFWFDLLNKVMVVRSTVKPREKSQDEGSEDRAATGPSTPSRPTATVFLK
jgi:hypothetical protein